MTTQQLSELLQTLREHGVMSYRNGDLAVVFGSPTVALPSAAEPQADPNDPAEAYAQWEREALHSAGTS